MVAHDIRSIPGTARFCMGLQPVCTQKLFHFQCIYIPGEEGTIFPFEQIYAGFISLVHIYSWGDIYIDIHYNMVLQA